MATLLVIFSTEMYLTSPAANTPINLIQKVSIITHNTKQDEEGNGLRGNTLNNVNGVFDAEDAKVRKFFLTGRGHSTCDLFPRK